MFAATATVPLLIATKPLLPRENPTAIVPSSQLVLRSVPATDFRNRIIWRIHGSRCSQSHWPSAAVAGFATQFWPAIVPFAAGGPASRPPCDVGSNEKPDMIIGYPYGSASMNTFASRATAPSDHRNPPLRCVSWFCRNVSALSEGISPQFPWLKVVRSATFWPPTAWNLSPMPRNLNSEMSDPLPPLKPSP